MTVVSTAYNGDLGEGVEELGDRINEEELSENRRE